MIPAMKLSERGRLLIADWEDVKTEVYLDSGGVPTIGIGHVITRSERLSGKIRLGNGSGKYSEGLTVEQCRQLFAQDVEPVERAICESVNVPLSQSEFDALVSFVFNVGIQAFKDSTLLKRLNAGEYQAVPAQLRRWKHDNGVVVQGLVNRREKEVALWLS